MIENSSFLLPEDSKWIVVESKGDPVYIEAVASRLMELGSPGVVISGEGEARVEGYLHNDIHLKRNLEELGTYTDSLMHLGLSGEKVESRPLPAIDWVRDFRERCVPRKVGPYQILPGFHPEASERDRPADGEDEGWIRILLTPAMAFGTGEHPTTRLCLLTLGDIFRHKKKGRLTPKRVLDIGCGSGILGIAAALSFPACRVSSVDLEPGSIHAAQENARRNRVASRMTAREGSIERTQGRFDLIFANLFLDPLLTMTPILVRRLKVAGIAILSGILTHQTPRLVSALRAEGVDLIGTSSEKEWACLTMKKS